MNASPQAIGRVLWPRDHNYPWRVMIWEERGTEWRLIEVFEEKSFAYAEEQGMNCCTEPWAEGVTAMHYYVGEVA